MKEGLILRQWKTRDGKPRFPEPIIKRAQCFHEKQTEAQPGDLIDICMVCGKAKVDVEAMRAEINTIPKWLRKLCKLRLLWG